jgi:hypothetical protein
MLVLVELRIIDVAGNRKLRIVSIPSRQVNLLQAETDTHDQPCVD